MIEELVLLGVIGLSIGVQFLMGRHVIRTLRLNLRLIEALAKAMASHDDRLKKLESKLASPTTKVLDTSKMFL